MIKIRVKEKYLNSAKMTVYTGYITVYKNKKYLWSKFSGINRLSFEDAFNDGSNLRDEILSLNLDDIRLPNVWEF